MSLQPNAVSILAMVCMVKLCLPVIHLDISDSLLWSFWAKSFWVRFFDFRTSLMRSAIPNESSNSAFCSSGTAARHCLNKVFCFIIVDFMNCLHVYIWFLHSGSSCQLLEGKPMAVTSTEGYVARRLFNWVLNESPLPIESSQYAIQQVMAYSLLPSMPVAFIQAPLMVAPI